MSTPFLKINDQLLECSYYSISGVLISISTSTYKTPLFYKNFYIFCRNMYCTLLNVQKIPTNKMLGFFKFSFYVIFGI